MAENLSLLATESASLYENLEQQSVDTLLRQMNAEDKTVPHSVEKVIPAIEALVMKDASGSQVPGTFTGLDTTAVATRSCLLM